MKQRHHKVARRCLNCGKSFFDWVSRIKIGNGKFCSTRCGKVGKFNHAWKGGIKRGNGYVWIYNPSHPFATKRGYITEHRLLMEKEIGRFLTKSEVVHHLNGIRDDNRIENLRLLKNQGEHYTLHMLGNKIWLGKKHKPETIEKMKLSWTEQRKKKQGINFAKEGNPNYRHGNYCQI